MSFIKTYGRCYQRFDQPDNNQENNQENPIPPTPSHDYVEIGGVKWATMNVGATSITDYGLYFQWGDTQGYTAAQCGSGEGQKNFVWVDYKYGNGTSSPGASGMTKYCLDGKTVLDLSDDAAQTAWGGSWRMPTVSEWRTLGEAVNSAWTADYQGSGVSGLVLTDKTDSSKVLFFPAAGRCSYDNVSDVGKYGYCWSSSRYYNIVKAQNAYTINFYNSKVVWDMDASRYNGYPVRGVFDE